MELSLSMVRLTTLRWINLPQNTPAQSAKPWTESLRISSANNEYGTQNSGSKAFAVVNRLGILTFNDETIVDGSWTAPHVFKITFEGMNVLNIEYLNII